VFSIRSSVASKKKRWHYKPLLFLIFWDSESFLMSNIESTFAVFCFSYLVVLLLVWNGIAIASNWRYFMFNW
jgi:hypothetical protein